MNERLAMVSAEAIQLLRDQIMFLERDLVRMTLSTHLYHNATRIVNEWDKAKKEDSNVRKS